MSSVGPPTLAPPPYAAPPPRRRHGCRTALLIAGLVTLVLLVVGAVGLVILLRNLSTPHKVPADYRPPTALPQASATAAIPAGDLVFDSDRTGNYELFAMSGTGQNPRQLTDDSRYDSWWARLSPDRRTILFYRSPKGSHDRDYSSTSLWAIGADGSQPTLVRPAGLDGWVLQGHAEWSPDGSRLVMFGGSRSRPQIQITDRQGQNPTAITDRAGSNVDPSWSPDGSTIVFSGCPGQICKPSDHEIYTVASTGGPVTRLTDDGMGDNDPYYSHSGTQLAWLTKVSGILPGVWDIRVAPADGSNPRRLIGDDNINSKPSWSLDDRTIFFHRLDTATAKGFQVWAVSPDGSDLRLITKDQPGANEYPGT